MNGATIRTLADHLSWMSPALGLVLASSVVVALVYITVAVQPLRILPLYWLTALAGLAAGQLVAQHGPRFVVVGDVALGDGVLACIVLFALIRIVALYYTEKEGARPPVRREPLQRERFQL